MSYVLYENGVLEKDGFYLPVDELNPDYAAYRAWPAAGNSPEIRPAAEYLAKVNDDITTRAQVRAEYKSTIDTLADIETRASPSNAQVIAAVRFLAKTLRLLLKILVRWLF